MLLLWDAMCKEKAIHVKAVAFVSAYLCWDLSRIRCLIARLERWSNQHHFPVTDSVLLTLLIITIFMTLYVKSC